MHLFIPQNICNVKVIRKTFELRNALFFNMNKSRHGIAFIVNVENRRRSYPKEWAACFDSLLYDIQYVLEPEVRRSTLILSCCLV